MAWIKRILIFIRRVNRFEDQIQGYTKWKSNKPYREKKKSEKEKECDEMKEQKRVKVPPASVVPPPTFGGTKQNLWNQKLFVFLFSWLVFLFFHVLLCRCRWCTLQFTQSKPHPWLTMQLQFPDTLWRILRACPAPSVASSCAFFSSPSPSFPSPSWPPHPISLPSLPSGN